MANQWNKAGKNPTHQPGTPKKHQTNCRRCPFKPGCIPRDLEGEQLAQFEQQVVHMHQPLKANRALISQGDRMDALYALRVGSMKAIINEADGSEHVMGFRFPGAAIGLAEPEQERWSRTFIALEDSWLCRIPFTIVGDETRRQLIRLMSAHLRHEYASHLSMLEKNAEHRIAQFLIEISNNFSARGYSAAKFHLPMSYLDIANYLGLRNESLSRSMRKLQKNGLLDKTGRFIHILDLEAIHELAVE